MNSVEIVTTLVLASLPVVTAVFSVFVLRRSWITAKAVRESRNREISRIIGVSFDADSPAAAALRDQINESLTRYEQSHQAMRLQVKEDGAQINRLIDGLAHARHETSNYEDDLSFASMEDLWAQLIKAQTPGGYGATSTEERGAKQQ